MEKNERTFELKVSLKDPNPPKGRTTMPNVYEYEVNFNTDESDYGNGTYMAITSPIYDTKWIDLRYEPFKKGEEIEWIVKWANNYWNGENGSWRIEFISVKRKTIKE